MSSWREKEAEYQAVHSFIQSVENEIEEVLRGQGKRKSRESPPFMPPSPQALATDSEATECDPSQSQEHKTQRPNLGIVVKGCHGRSSESMKTSGFKDMKSTKVSCEDGMKKENVEDTDKAKEFEKRKAAICFGSESTSQPSAVTHTVTNETSAAFAFLEDSAFADNLYATVISPLEKKRSKQTVQLSGQSAERTKIGDPYRGTQEKDAVGRHSGDSNRENQQQYVPDEKDRDILLESLLTHDTSQQYQQGIRSPANRNYRPDSIQQSLPVRGRQNKQTAALPHKQKVQPQAKNYPRGNQQRQQASPPPPPPKRTSSIRKCQTARQAARGPVQITKSPTSIEKLQHRLLQNRQNSKSVPHETSLSSEDPKLKEQHAQKQQQGLRNESLKKANKIPHSSNNQQSIPVLKSKSQPRSAQQQVSRALGNYDKQQNIQHHQRLRLLDDPPHSVLSEAEKAQKERAARLMQIYEDVKNISRPPPDSSSTPGKAFESSDQVGNKTSQKHSADYHYSDVKQKTPFQLNQHQRQSNRQTENQQNRRCTIPQVSQHKNEHNLQRPHHQQFHDKLRHEFDHHAKSQIHQEKSSLIYQNVDTDKHRPTIPRRSPYSQSKRIHHTSRALSDHGANISKPSHLPRPPRRFSDSETYSDLDSPRHDNNAISPLGNQTFQDHNLTGIVADANFKTDMNFDFLMSGRCNESDSAPSLCFSPPPILSFGLERRLSDTALYSSQFSDIDEMTSSMEESLIVTPPPEFMNEPEDVIPDNSINTPASFKTDENDMGLKRSAIPVALSPKETSSCTKTATDTRAIAVDGSKENRPRRKTTDSASVLRIFSQESPKALHLRGPPARGELPREMPGRYHLLAGAEVCQATQGVLPLLQARSSERAKILISSPSSASYPSEISKYRAGERRKAPQDLDIAERNMNAITRCVPNNHQKQNFRSPPDGAPDKDGGGNFLSWSHKPSASRLTADDSCLVPRPGDSRSRNGQEESTAPRAHVLYSQPIQRTHERSMSGITTTQVPNSSIECRTRARGTNSTSSETQVRSFGTNPKTPVFSKKAFGYSDYSNDRDKPYDHMGNNQSVVKSPKGDISLCGVRRPHSLNGNGGNHDFEKPQQNALASCLGSQSNNNDDVYYDKHLILTAGGSQQFQYSKQNGEDKAQFCEANTQAFETKCSHEGSHRQEIQEEKKIMLRDTAVQTSLELDGYAVDISSSLEDLHDSVMNDSKISEIETSGELVQNKETGCISYKGHDEPEPTELATDINLQVSLFSGQNDYSESVKPKRRDETHIHRQKFDFENTPVQEGGTGKRISATSNSSLSRSSRPLIARSKSLHSDAGATHTEITRQMPRVKDEYSPVERRQREADKHSVSRPEQPSGSTDLSGSLRELRHLNIDVSQRLVDGEKRFVVVNGGSPDLQVVVNSLTPVLSRRRHRSGGSRRVAVDQRFDERGKQQLPSNYSCDGTESYHISDSYVHSNKDFKNNGVYVPSHQFTTNNSSPAIRGTFFEGPNQEFHFSSNSHEAIESLPMYVRLRSHDGAIEHTISHDPYSPRKLTEDDFALSQNKNKEIYQVSEELLMMRKQGTQVSAADQISKKYAKTTPAAEERDSYPTSGKVWKSDEIKKSRRDNLLNFLPPGMNDLAEELEKSRQSLFLSPKLSHTWHGPTSDLMPPGYRQAPRMGLGVYFQEAASKGRLPFKTMRNTSGGESRPMSAEEQAGVDQESSSRHSHGSTGGYFHGHTLPVISRTLLDAMHKRYCSHQYSPTLMQHLQPCSAHTIPASATPSHPVSRSSQKSSQAPPVTALRVEPPVNPSTRKVHAAPPSPQVMARLKQMLLEHQQQQQQQQIQQKQQHQQDQHLQNYPDAHPSDQRSRIRHDNSSAVSQHHSTDEGVEPRSASAYKHRTGHVGISSLPPHVKARLLAVAQSQGHLGLSGDGKPITEMDLEPSPSVIRVCCLFAAVFVSFSKEKMLKSL